MRATQLCATTSKRHVTLKRIQNRLLLRAQPRRVAVVVVVADRVPAGRALPGAVAARHRLNNKSAKPTKNEVRRGDTIVPQRFRNQGQRGIATFRLEMSLCT